MMELAPKGKGKSHIFTNLSRHVFLQSGDLTSAQLFKNQTTKKIGLIGRYDLLVLDEVQNFKGADDIHAKFKDYLESGRYSIGGYEITSECGLMMRNGYNVKVLSEILNAKPREVRSFLCGQLPPGRVQELHHELLAAGVPL